jgi:hypothetical protein
LLTLSDFVHIPYTPDLTEAGILYACRCLALDRVQASNLDLAPLRRLSAEIAADLSLRRYLAQEHISYKILDAEPFTHPDRNEIILGGRPCHVINTLIRRKEQIDRIEGNPAMLLPTPASLPEAALTSERWGYQDLLIFTFTLTKPKLARGASSIVQTDGKTDYLIYILPKSWRNTRIEFATLGLEIQNASNGEVTLELGGQTSNRDFVSQFIRLPSRQSVIAVQGFSRLAYLGTRHAPTATISLHDRRRQHSLHIPSDHWGNLEVDGVEIILAGYIEVGEFRRRAHRPRHSALPREIDGYPSQGPSIPIQDLLPLPELIAWLRRIQGTN